MALFIKPPFTNFAPTNAPGNKNVLGVHASGTTIYATTNDGLNSSNDGGTTWTNHSSGLGWHPKEVFVDNNTIYVATASGLSISTDGGSTFTNKTTINGLINNSIRGVFASGSNIYAATSSGLGISEDNGETWKNHTTANGLGDNFVYGVDVNQGAIYAATASGLSISGNNGETWKTYTSATLQVPANCSVRGVYASGATICAATLGGGLSISADGGASWTNYSKANGLGDDFVYGVYGDQDGTIYAATKGGLSISADGGKTWHNYTAANGLGANDLFGVYVNQAGTIYAATSGGLSISNATGTYGITRTTSDGRYGIGKSSPINLNFSETIYVTSTPTLSHETGNTDRTAIYNDGSGTNTLNFDYTVQVGNSSSGLDINSSAALPLPDATSTIKDAAGHTINLTLPAPGTLGSPGANGELVIDDEAPSTGTTFTTTQGAIGLIKKPITIDQTTDPQSSGRAIVTTRLDFMGVAREEDAAPQLEKNLGNPNSSPKAITISEQISFRVSPSISTAGIASARVVQDITDDALLTFQSSSQEVDLYFPEAETGSDWNTLYKKEKSGVYYLFNYDPLTGPGGVLLDRDSNGKIDGARPYLKDGALGDFNETVNGQIDDPIGFTTLSNPPALRISDDKQGFTVDGVEGSGVWITMDMKAFIASTESNLEVYNSSTNQFYGAIGATLGSGPASCLMVDLSAGTTIHFRNGDGQTVRNLALNITSTGQGFSLGLDADRDGLYAHLLLNISSAITAPSPACLAIARKQFSNSDASLDLTSIAATGMGLTLDISTDCGLRNQFGFIKLELDPLTRTTYQVAGVSQHEGAAFRSAVPSQFLNPNEGTGTSHRHGQTRQSISRALDSRAAGYYAPVMITQAGEVFTFGASTASDGRQHVKLLGTNTFGFEDLLASQGSDWDFNDLKAKVSFV